MSQLPGDPSAARRSNVLLWLAPAIAIAGFLSYWGYFVRWPFLRDTGLLNLGLLLLAVVLSALALRRAWSGGLGRRLLGVLGLVVSLGLTGLFVAYCYVLSYGLPPSDDVVALGERLPAVSLVSHEGEPVDLAEASQGPLVLVFYRGFW